jgi:hypothetical protein
MPKIEAYWVKQIEVIAISTGSTPVFEAKLQWPNDRARFYAVMGVCAQRCTDIVLIPERIREMQWYKSHEWWVPEYVCGMDMASQFMAFIEQDLREQGLIDDEIVGELDSTRRSKKKARTKQGSKKPGRPPKYSEKQKALTKKRFEDLMIAGRQTLEAWAIVAEEHGFPSGDAARKQCH